MTEYVFTATLRGSVDEIATKLKFIADKLRSGEYLTGEGWELEETGWELEDICD